MLLLSVLYYGMDYFLNFMLILLFPLWRNEQFECFILKCGLKWMQYRSHGRSWEWNYCKIYSDLNRWKQWERARERDRMNREEERVLPLFHIHGNNEYIYIPTYTLRIMTILQWIALQNIQGSSMWIPGRKF